MKPTLILIALLLPALASADHHSSGGGKGKSAGMLSEQEITALRAGKGQGMAKIAERNRYPGPRHVLELAEELALSDEQLQQTQSLFADMKRRAMALGEQIISAEEALAVDFSQGPVDAAAVRASLLEIGSLRAELRYTHIETHLRQRQILTDAQVAVYDEARGNHRGKHAQGKHVQGKQGQGKQGQGKQGKGKHGQGKHGDGKHGKGGHGMQQDSSKSQ